MKVICIDNKYQWEADGVLLDPTTELVLGKTYEVLSISEKIPGWYQIIDESGEDYLYSPELFKIVCE